MMDHPENMRQEIAATAARMIAEEGLSYDQAKRKAARQLLGNRRISGDFLPDNELIEAEVRLYNALFLGDSQPARLLHLRKTARALMALLADFNPWLIGAVLNGTGGEHTDIYLQLFTENGKDVQIFLLNRHIDFEVTESPHSGKEIVETLHFMWHDEIAHVTVYSPDAIRQGGRIDRANLDMLDQLIAASL